MIGEGSPRIQGLLTRDLQQEDEVLMATEAERSHNLLPTNWSSGEPVGWGLILPKSRDSRTGSLVSKEER